MSLELLKKSHLKNSVGITSVLLMLSALGQPVYAQDQDTDEIEDDAVEEVIVTGSRIRRNAFTSASPIQVISGQQSRELGLFDTAELMQSSNQASGLQIDNTFTSFVLDNGPGAATLDLRGLGPERTLVLLNGRRIAPAGVGGAPVAADLNLLPSIMVDRIESLLDGASSVYGSDAVAGVANIIMRKDVEGFEIEASYDKPEQDGGEEMIVSAIWGKTTDKGSIQVAAEYYDRKPVEYGQRKITRACNEYYYEDENGNILTEYRGLAPGTTPSNCKLETINRMFYPFVFGNLWATPGTSNLVNDGSGGFGIPFDGVPGWSETVIGLGLEFYNPGALAPIDINGDGVIDQALIDPDGDGLSDVDLQSPFYNAAQSERYLKGHFLSPLERINVYGSGELIVDEDTDTTLYFEARYSQRKSDVFSPGAALFPDVAVDNPYNPCGIYGVDCLGFFGPFGGYAGVTPIVVIENDRDYNDVKVYQYNITGGARGNLPALDNFGEGNWAYDAYVSYTRSKGTDKQFGVREDRLMQALDASFDADGNVVCNDPSNGCVPVNMFAQSIYQEGGGNFATQAETDFLFGERSFVTTIEQTIASGILTGDLFTLPWNDAIVPLVVGYEYRRDKIDSIPNEVAAEGLLYAFFSDRGASGARTLNEFFAETEFQLLRGEQFAEELTLQASARWTDESFFDPAWTYSLKGIYRPVNWFTFRGSYGTSYRAPNLREQFLNETTGFLTISDPCVVPANARTPGDPADPLSTPTYNPAEETRTERVLNACSASGVDPTALGLAEDRIGTYSVEVATGGSKALNEETSTGFTYGMVFEQPWTDTFDLSLSVTWFDFDVRSSIEEPGTQFSISRCLDNIEQPGATSEFCDRLSRDNAGYLDKVDTSFINIGRITAVGQDFNLFYSQDFEVGEKNLNVSLDVRASRLKEQIYQVIDEIDDNAGETEAPHWRANAILRLEYDDFAVNWATRWIQGGEEEPDDFSTTAPPCDGLGVGCRPVYYTSNYDVHDASITWSPGDFVMTVGVSNVFDTEPPRIDTGGVFGINNFPLGISYDLYGRTVFASLKFKY